MHIFSNFLHPLPILGSLTQNFCPKTINLQLQTQRLADMDDYRFTNIDQEPTDEQLSQLMREVAEDAKERYEKARNAYFAQLTQMVQAI